MVQEALSRVVLCLSCSLLLGVCFPAEGAAAAGPLPTFPPEEESGESDLENLERGSGSSLLHLLDSFPADSPFLKETPAKPVNCTERFWLPPTSDICWEDIAGPEEFERSRLLILQNRAALQAVSSSCGLEEGGISYEHQAREVVHGIQSDHQSVEETMQTMEKVFVSLEEQRTEGKEQEVLKSLKEHLTNTKHAIDGRDHLANILENHFSLLEKSLLHVKFRINKLIQQ